jgi:hypothetical protein
VIFQLKEEVRREPIRVSPRGLQQHLGGHAIQFRQFRIEQYVPAADHDDAAFQRGEVDAMLGHRTMSWSGDAGAGRRISHVQLDSRGSFRIPRTLTCQFDSGATAGRLR